jgi:hypothetical protein
MKKKLAWLGLVLITFAIGVALLFFNLPDSDPVCKANFGRIRKGMTTRDVEDIFGKAMHTST